MNPRLASRPFLTRRMLIIGSVLLLLAVIGIILSSISKANDPRDDMSTLLARLDTLQELTALGVKHVKGSDIKKVNSDASLIISGDVQAIEKALASQGVEQASKADQAAEADPKTLANLEDARVNGSFDSAYPTALREKLLSTNALMQSIHGRTKNGSVKAALSTAYSDFGRIAQQLQDL